MSEEFQGEYPALHRDNESAEDHARHIGGGIEMGPQKYLHCRDIHNEKGCSLGLAGNEAEVIKAAVEHAVSWHKEPDTPSLRERIAQRLHSNQSGHEHHEHGIHEHHDHPGHDDHEHQHHNTRLI